MLKCLSFEIEVGNDDTVVDVEVNISLLVKAKIVSLQLTRYCNHKELKVVILITGNCLKIDY